VSGLERVTRDISFPSDWLNQTIVNVNLSCPAGKTAISVGFVPLNNLIIVQAAHVAPEGFGQLAVRNATGGTITAGADQGDMSVMCANVS
jgi:hypothetical protein